MSLLTVVDILDSNIAFEIAKKTQNGPDVVCWAHFISVLCKFTLDRLSNKKATRARISMMPIGTPRVPYRTPGEGTWQWLDIWNALVRPNSIDYMLPWVDITLFSCYAWISNLNFPYAVP
jgi:hypothetical protein